MEDPGGGSQDYFSFAVGAFESIGGGEVELKVGGAMLPGVLIDSGASCYLIDRSTGELLKKKGVPVSPGNQTKSCLPTHRRIL